MSHSVQEIGWTISSAAELLSAMGNERRLEVLRHLVRGEATVTEIGEVVDLSQSALSQHLAILRHAGMVQTRRDAQAIYYSIKSAAVLRILDLLAISDPTMRDAPLPSTRRAVGA